MSEIKVNSIKGVGASAAAITVNNTDGTCTANITNKPNRNLIINGAMTIAQRGVSSTTSGYGSVDRIELVYSGTDEAPTQEQANVAAGTSPYTNGFRKSFKITNGNQTSGAGAADFIWYRYKLEAQDIATSGWNYVTSSSNITLSFWIKSSVAQTFKGYLRSMDGTQYVYPFETGSLTADTWTKITKTISGNSNLTFENDANQGMQINILAFMGTDYSDNSVTENAWATYAGGTRIKDSTSTWYTTNDATLEFTGFQLEVGSVATDFEHRSFGQELQLCKRYFNMYSRTDSDLGNESIIANGFYFTTTRFMAPLRFDVPMRTNSWSLYKVVGSNYFSLFDDTGGEHQVADIGLNGQGHNQSAHLNITGITSSGAAGMLHTKNTAARIGFDAEL